MKDATDYLNHIKALVLLNQKITHWEVIREEAQGDIGLFRYRLTLKNDSLLEIFERFQIVDQEVQVTKYSFHWQNAKGKLRKRWDNAAHHPEISTHPHHVHKGEEENVLPHAPTSVEKILELVTAQTTD